MLGKRILTALVGIPLAIYIIHKGGYLFAAAVLGLALTAWHEFSAMLSKKGIHTFLGLGFLGITAILACALWGNSEESLALVLFLLIFALMKTVISPAAVTITDAAFTIMGVFYIALPFAALFLLRDSAESITTTFGLVAGGEFYLYLAFLTTWASDTAAYFVGTQFGRHKLCPAVSPNKSVEGALGGLLGSIMTVVAVGSLAALPLCHLLILGLITGIFAPFGDLVESALKRFAGVKDSGNFFPGHGGVLDRFDAMMFAVPVVYYYVNIFFR
ncbi:MAG: phosphatidate cytidylyltransferase [Sporomusaceae bacterium]|jgi:phosphatidate cytidylyltransferase|nr:phosphatidate cytidylyltransferase [Sporomusaceae bacterium]